MRITAGMIPPGGWHYKDPSGYRIPHTGELESADKVEDAILTYRLENHIPAANPKEDLEHYICNNFPSWCRMDAPSPEPLPPRPEPNRNSGRFVDVIALWANSLLDIVGGLTLIPQREAEERATICQQCPLQVSWEHECPSCVESCRRITKMLRQGKEVTQWRKLKGCVAHGFCTQTAVHLDPKHLMEPNEAAPSNCWMRNIK